MRGSIARYGRRRAIKFPRKFRLASRSGRRGFPESSGQNAALPSRYNTKRKRRACPHTHARAHARTHTHTHIQASRVRVHMYHVQSGEAQPSTGERGAGERLKAELGVPAISIRLFLPPPRRLLAPRPPSRGASSLPHLRASRAALDFDLPSSLRRPDRR
jgi:hypothetical protein